MSKTYNFFLSETSNTFTIDFNKYGIINDNQIMELEFNEINIVMTTSIDYVNGLIICSNDIGKDNYIDEIGFNPLVIIPCQSATANTFSNNFKTNIKISNPYNRSISFSIRSVDGELIVNGEISSILLHLKLK